MALIYTGIDEAGYGPMLGPLCVASATFRVDMWNPGDHAPDLWEMLGQAVCQSKKDAKSKIAVGDSKQLKLSNSSKTKHPLYHLERGVLAFLGACGRDVPSVDSMLHEMVGAELDECDWYRGEGIELPLGIEREMLGIEVNSLKAAMSKAGVELLDLRVRVVGEREFNHLYTEHRSKAAATGRAVSDLMRSARQWEVEGVESRIVCDRQSGRLRYGGLLSQIFDDVAIEEESPRASRYRCDHRTGVLLTPGADDAYFPVAFASMAAKLVRELAMMRFNRYWESKMPELKPTAGYVQDARRWLDDTSEIVTDAQRREMIRLA